MKITSHVEHLVSVIFEGYLIDDRNIKKIKKIKSEQLK